MLGLRRLRRPAIVAFDIIGTVFPLEPLRSAVVALGLPPAGLEGWFAAGCRDAFALAAAGDFEPFATVLEATLDLVRAEQGLDPPAHEREAVMERFQTLDAREAFSILGQAGIGVAALSNGAKAATRSLLARSNVDDLVQAIVSVDEVRLAKPRPETYRHAADVAGVAPGAMALVAAHPWDINGAAAAGLVTAYLAAERPYSRVMRRPDLDGATLPDLAR